MTGFVLLAIALLTALLSVFVLTRSSGSGDGASPAAVQPQVMPGMGSMMPESTHVPMGAWQLNVAIGDYWFKAGKTRLPAGVYTFKARNYGVVQHDIMIERMPIMFSAPGAPLDKAAPYGLDGMEPGMTKSTKVVLTAGRWELFCSVPGHYQAGQRQIITVYGRMPPGLRPPAGQRMAPGSGMGASPSMG
jgi:uncharacterized cupredoxin-like copper-binding protein